ncbi:methylesterase 1-like [Euphorbia lathyris]|uniref:methylesterase 1-like n=1 Tax=Euphorbia lathyris TaxID=212925 RepID=UPI003313144F
MANQQQHIVLVHGAGHGAWCWYKVKPMLEAAGHRVTALDLAASGIHPAKIEEVCTLGEYTEPLLYFLACLPPEERVVLVGHSLGGMNLALAMETFPHKIAVAVFLTALMPDTEHRPSFVIEKFLERTPTEAWLDTKFFPYSSRLMHQIAILFGPNYLANMYQLSPVKDIELGKLLVRPSSFFLHDLCEARNFTSEKYGSVKKVFIISEQDKAIPPDFQRWMIQNYHVHQVFNIEESDHMVMLSKLKELTNHLSQIAIDYA